MIKESHMTDHHVDSVAHMFTDPEGRPEGGTTQAPGLLIAWQRGPLRDSASGTENPRNGAFVMDVIEAAATRLHFYQRSPFACEENEVALVHLDAALAALQARIDRRTAEGVQGTWQK
jgi:hypothetical protein